MKKSIIITLLLTLLLAGIAEASQEPGYVWIDTAFPCVLSGGMCIPQLSFRQEDQINLIVGFFAPDAGDWEVNWILSDSDGSMVYVIYPSYTMSAQSYAVKVHTVSLPAGLYYFNAAVIGRAVGKGAVSRQYAFVVYGQEWTFEACEAGGTHCVDTTIQALPHSRALIMTLSNPRAGTTGHFCYSSWSFNQGANTFDLSNTAADTDTCLVSFGGGYNGCSDIIAGQTFSGYIYDVKTWFDFTKAFTVYTGSDHFVLEPDGSVHK